MTSYRPGDIIIHSIKLWSIDRSRSVDDMRHLIKNIKIYEAITDPVMTAVFTIVDGIGLAENFPMIGEEYLELDIETPGTDDVHTLRFDVVDIRDKSQVDGGKSSVYNLYCMSKEFKKNAQVIFGRYPDANPLEIIQKVLSDNISTDKSFNAAQATFAKIDIDINQLSPFEAIDKIRRFTRNVQELSSAFCFYENKYGFNMYSVEQLYESGKTKIGDKVFFMDSVSNRSIYENNFRQILEMERLSEVAPLRGMIDGQLNAKVKTFDLLTGTISDKTYLDAEQGDAFSYADDDYAPLRSSASQEDAGMVSKQILNIIDTSKSDMNIQESVLERTSYVNKLIQQIYRMEVYGDLVLNAGDVIEVNLPPSSGVTDRTESSPDRRFAGNFMISKIVHNIDMTSSRHFHTSSCELIKGNLRS